MPKKELWKEPPVTAEGTQVKQRPLAELIKDLDTLMKQIDQQLEEMKNEDSRNIK